MKTLIVYDSVYGNTEKITKAIGDAITGEVKMLRVGEVNTSELEAFDLLIVGSPTQAGRPTKAIQDFLNQVTTPAFQDTRVAAFDTRLTRKWVGIFGYAAGGIAGSLKKNGAILVAPPKAFFVKGIKGPLEDGEIEHAADWAKEISKAQ